jgi:hypothetical protein
VNAVFLLMSTTLAAGQETPPPPATPVLAQPAPTWPSPAYGVPNGGCSSCGVGIAPGCSDPCPCEGRKGLFSRRKSDDCDCSPKEKREKRKLFHGFTTSACDGGKDRGGLFSHLHARFNKGGDCAAGCDTIGGCDGSAWGGPAIGGCALPPVPSYVAPSTPSVTPATPAESPKPMEKPKESPKNGTTNVSLTLPAPTPLPVPSIPVLADKQSPF